MTYFFCFPSAGDAPFSSGYACHLFRFIGKVYPEGGSNLFVIAREQRDRGNPHEKVRILFQRFSALTLDFGEKSEYNNIL